MGATASTTEHTNIAALTAQSQITIGGNTIDSRFFTMQEGTYDFGRAFEHFVILEAMRLASYARADWTFSYLRTKDDAEIDLVIDRPGQPVALLEIKSTPHVSDRDVASLARFASDLEPCEALCLSRDPHEKRIGPVACLPWMEGLRRLGL
jgi:hypothetical protein